MAPAHSKITFIGFGEAAQAFTEGLRQECASHAIRAFDIKTRGPQAEAKRADYSRWNVVGEKTSAEACENADIIFSLVTVDQAENAASQAAKLNLNGCLYLDCNSCAPETKRRSAGKIGAAGGRYVDVAVMTPVHPRLHKSPCLLAGPDARDAHDKTQALGMSTEIAGDQVGTASMHKMVRSVMIKGLEALTLECFLAGRKAGIEADTLESLEASFPGFDWRRRAPYMIERAISHGTRRAAEMQEAALTLRDLGIAPHMAEATVARQSQVGALGLDASEFGDGNLPDLTAAILTELADRET